jgi:hypothetical protein
MVNAYIFWLTQNFPQHAIQPIAMDQSLAETFAQNQEETI